MSDGRAGRGGARPAGAAGPMPLLAPLQRRDYRLVWFGESVSLLGDQFHYVALSWLVLELTGSGLALGHRAAGGVAAARRLPAVRRRARRPGLAAGRDARLQRHPGDPHDGHRRPRLRVADRALAARRRRVPCSGPSTRSSSRRSARSSRGSCRPDQLPSANALLQGTAAADDHRRPGPGRDRRRAHRDRRRVRHRCRVVRRRGHRAVARPTASASRRRRPRGPERRRRRSPPAAITRRSLRALGRRDSRRPRRSGPADPRRSCRRPSTWRSPDRSWSGCRGSCGSGSTATRRCSAGSWRRSGPDR